MNAPDLETQALKLSNEEQRVKLIAGSGKLQFLQLLLPKLKERGHRVLLFSQVSLAKPMYKMRSTLMIQFKIALDLSKLLESKTRCSVANIISPGFSRL